MRTDADQYQRHLQALMPLGRAWSREDDATLSQLLAGFATALARNHNRGVDLINEADPRTTLELLPDWERVCGLPDNCTAAGETVQERRAVVVAKVTARGGQSIAYFSALAERLGYVVTVEERQPFTFGASEFGGGEEMAPAEIRFRWRAAVHEPRVTWLEFGVSRFGPAGFGVIARAEDLECIIRRLKPGHTEIDFAYEGS